MKKLFCLCLFSGLAVSSFAFSAGDLFIKNSRFWQNKFSLDIMSEEPVFLGFSFNLTDHRDFNKKIYSFGLPFMLSFPLFDLVFEPFIYPNTNNDAWAYGGSITLKGLLRSDEINNTSSQGYLRAGFANQNANITRIGGTNEKENFRQFAFEGGLNFNFQNLFNFDINGNIYTYPDEVKNIAAFGGIMNQNEIANLGTIDYVLNLPHYSIGGGITWLSTETNAKSSLSYKYVNYENDLKTHSVMIQTKVPLEQHLILTLIYNHLFETHGKNRDLFGVGLNYLF